MLLSFLVLLAVSVSSVSISSEAYYQSCQVSDFNPAVPNSVAPGQTVQVTATIVVNCAQWRTYYSARVDLLDHHSQRILSTSTFQIGWKPNVTAIVSNAAVAPQSSGPWALQLNLYIFEEAGEVGSFNHVFDVQVGNAVANAPPTNSTSSTTLAPTSTVVASQTPSPLENNPASTWTSPGVGETVYILIALAVAGVLCAALIFRGRKHAT